MLLKVGSGYSWNRVLSQRKPRRTAWILEIFCFLLWMPVKRVHSVCENSSRVSLIFHFLYIYYNFKKNFQKRDFILYFKLVKNSLHMKDCQSLQFVNTSHGHWLEVKTHFHSSTWFKHLLYILSETMLEPYSFSTALPPAFSAVLWENTRICYKRWASV